MSIKKYTIILFGLIIADIVLTYYALTNMEMLELNPICNMIGIDMFLIFKIFTITFPLIFLWYYTISQKLAYRCCQISILLYSGVLINNLYSMSRVL